MLREYGSKRHFDQTPEPRPLKARGSGQLIFVVQKHAPRQLHYDFRLEVEGVLKSWSVPAGPSLNPSIKRLAVMVEDHPLDYRSFEGIISKGQYGAGQVIVWDEGTYYPEEADRFLVSDRSRAQEIMKSGLESGKISFTLNGHKLRGSWTLVMMKGSGNNWLLIKHSDEFAALDNDVLARDESVLSGLTIEDLRAGRTPLANTPEFLTPDKIEGARKAPFPSLFRPMLAYLAAVPPTTPGWLFEPKLDGYRILTFIRRGKAQLFSRNGLEVTGNYPSLAEELGGRLENEMILDGEVIALDSAGSPCFQCLQRYLKSRRDLKGSPAPLVYYVFDMLYLDGYQLYDVPLINRKELLNHVLSESASVRRIAFFEEDGLAVYQTSIAQGFEGILAKRKYSVYRPGQRSHDWLKVKAIQSDDFVIGGYSQGLGNRSDKFGALLLGYYDADDRLIYAGHVGSGFEDADLFSMTEMLRSIRTRKCPFNSPPPLNAPTTWVKPELVAEVKFSEWTQEGRLRTPVFLRLRDDKKPEEVQRSNVARTTDAAKYLGENDEVLKQLLDPSMSFEIEVEGNMIHLTNVDREYWPAYDGRPSITKRDLLIYLAKVSSYILPHLKDRPLTLKRYPEGINGEFFYQRHWDEHRPDFVEAVNLKLANEGTREHLMCNNLATLIWLGQIGSIEFHTWFSRISVDPSELPSQQVANNSVDITEYPDFIIFDLDPYIYSGKEAHGAEPELNRTGFAAASQVAVWLKDILDSLSMSAFIKTSGRTGLHIYVPIVRRLNYRSVRSAARTIATYALQAHPEYISIDWAVDKRTGKVFIDHNQNVRGKTLGAVYAPRVAPEAAVSTPLRWDELDKIFPTDFTVLTIPDRLKKTGDPWEHILETKRDLTELLKM